MNKITKIFTSIVALLVAIFAGLYFYFSSEIVYIPKEEPQILLYGESHGWKKIYEKEYEIWKKYYDSGMRHLFIEDSYNSAQFLNIWMKEPDDTLLMKRYEGLKGTLGHNEWALEFFRKIKKNCPETVFHGTDVDHQYETTGKRYLEYLEKNGQKNSEEYKIAQKYIEQGKYYYSHNRDHEYRENMMAQNFIEQYEKLGVKKIMGIYGAAHTDPRKHGWGIESDGMAKQIKNHFGDIVSHNYVGSVWDYIWSEYFD